MLISKKPQIIFQNMSQATIYATQNIHCWCKIQISLGILYFIPQPSLALLTWLQSSGDSEAGQPAGLYALFREVGAGCQVTSPSVGHPILKETSLGFLTRFRDFHVHWLNGLVWANSSRYWRTRKPGVLQSMGSQSWQLNNEQQQGGFQEGTSGSCKVS